MSPSGSLQLQQSRKQCRQTTLKRLRSVTQLDIPREVLLSFQTHLSENFGFRSHLLAAVQELSDRMQQRTAILGTALENTGRAVLDLQVGQGILRPA